MSSAVLTAPASHKAQGRSASGRNGGARNTTSSNKEVMRRRLFVLSLFLNANNYLVACKYVAVLQLFACGPVLKFLDRLARSQLRLQAFLRYVLVISALLLYIPFTVGQSHVLV